MCVCVCMLLCMASDAYFMALRVLQKCEQKTHLKMLIKLIKINKKKCWQKKTLTARRKPLSGPGQVIAVLALSIGNK